MADFEESQPSSSSSNPVTAGKKPQQLRRENSDFAKSDAKKFAFLMKQCINYVNAVVDSIVIDKPETN